MQKPKAIELIIFDCDGVIVDSEYLACQIGAELITKAGYPIDAQTLACNYSGLVFLDILRAIEKTAAIPFSYNLVTQMHESFSQRMKTELQLIAGFKETLAKLTQAFCICSNSKLAHLEAMLEMFGLLSLFKGKIFSAPDMGSKKPKPAPDIYLFAAQQMQTACPSCLVIEDSAHGVMAAKEAGMRVVGFTGGRHSYPGHGEALMAAGSETVIKRHNELITLLPALQEWQAY